MPRTLTIGEAGRRTGWSPRMLRYLEGEGLVVPARMPSGYRRYGIRELNQLRTLAELRTSYGVGLDELAFALRLAGTSDPAADGVAPAWVEWEQRKQERLLLAPEAA